MSVIVGSRRLFSTRPTHKFPPAVSADEIHLFGTRRAKCALVAANVCCPAWRDSGSALFTRAFQFQRHFFLRTEQGSKAAPVNEAVRLARDT
jgi:hypothetical protein